MTNRTTSQRIYFKSNKSFLHLITNQSVNYISVRRNPATIKFGKKSVRLFLPIAFEAREKKCTLRLQRKTYNSRHKIYASDCNTTRTTHTKAKYFNILESSETWLYCSNSEIIHHKVKPTNSSDWAGLEKFIITSNPSTGKHRLYGQPKHIIYACTEKHRTWLIFPSTSG